MGNKSIINSELILRGIDNSILQKPKETKKPILVADEKKPVKKKVKKKK